jgi:hypothetical protein
MKSEKVAGLIVSDDGDRLMTLAETAARLQTSPASLRKLINNRELIPIKIGKNRFIRKYALNDFLARCEGQNLMDIMV